MSEQINDVARFRVEPLSRSGVVQTDDGNLMLHVDHQRTVTDLETRLAFAEKALAQACEIAKFETFEPDREVWSFQNHGHRPELYEYLKGKVGN